MAQMLLHGVIDAKILEADLSVTSDGKLRPTKKTVMKRKVFSWIKKLPFCNCQLENAIGLGPTSGKLYATVDIDKARVGRTRMVDPVHSPQWQESFHIYCAHDASNVIFTVKADNPVGATLIGRAYLPTGGAVVRGQQVDQWLPICDDKRQPLEGGDKIRVQLRFTAVGWDPAGRWDAGVGPAYPGVPRTFFGQRRGCRVRLYQDAHVADGFAPRVTLAGGRPYEARRCWEDVFEAISNARRMVYVAGWSVNTGVALVRDPRRPESGTTLGELLKRKAREGVKVLMLVWDDRTSVGLGPIKRDGLMATHDEDTAAYFRGSGVRCVLCPRNPDQGRSYVQDVETATMFTHHQKTVVVDGGVGSAGDPNASPRLVSFLGGIDLCDGRYDTQEHPLFRTLGTTHKNDFHQPNFPGSSIKKGGPREPWHDIHCRVEGPAAWDVLENFEQRWRKQGDGENHLVVLNKAWAERETAPEGDAESWNVQVFRSIDGGAAAGFPEKPDEAAWRGLVSGKDHVIERSIQDAYIHAIRRARDFVYIENQYFLGSSYAWRQGDGVAVESIDALHLIPKELSLKIVSKIEAGERFAVYVVVPMWPEGVPESGSVQAILDWQRRTMEMMYKDVALAIQAKGLQANPRDYLTFFCLGNREAVTPGEYVPPERPDPDTDYQRAQQARRFMIYVHAKMMIVDDEYIIVGSANINQRSMDGGRDSEIAMGAYQPGYLATRNRAARGQVHGFRVALWQEHLGRDAAAEAAGDLLQPSSLACVRRMNQVAEKHWAMFADDSFRGDLPGHLMAYPVGVGSGGELLNTRDKFPDTNAKVLGTKSNILPPILTT
ncbi:hypothetical protein EJB05_06328 [Eragrostis curvula]|uniref:Phospholipase D n=2 Tax=Eragrostis curvula TaxID=38414 RepID=A0A5J9WEQ4_9POAL|nr:hypothetical protein EJB05_06328 [Eragrostis curvula]